MNLGHRTRTGQALVMITLALFAMCGLLGLAVDLGWSFFVKKQAQAAADAAALGAVQRAMSLMFVNGVLTTMPACTVADCIASAVDCKGVGNASNLYNGCQYAIKNGFTSGSNSQKVTIQANDSTTLPTTPSGGSLGVNNIVYWVTVRTVQTVPQLFSALIGNTQGTVSAIATAGIVSTVVPGQMTTLDVQGDPMGGGDQGVNVRMTGGSSITMPGPAFLSSTCPTGTGGCAGGYAGQAIGANFTAGSIQTPVVNTTQGNFSPAPVVGAGSDFRDPTQGEAQPPIVANTPVRTCGIENGLLQSAGNGPVVVGPFNYYAYQGFSNNGLPIVIQRPITLRGDVQFSPTSANCPGIMSVTGAIQTGAFPSYFFYGGLNSQGNTTFGAGQYVMVGATKNINTGSANPVFSVAGGNVTGDSSVGTMFIFTAPGSPGFPGRDTQISAFPELGVATGGLQQGFVNIGSDANVALTGITAASANLPQELKQYSGIAFWQDKQNNSGSSAALELGRNSTTGTTLNINGVVYQPEGAYIDAQGNLRVQGATQFITGGILADGNGVIFNLAPVTNPLIKYVNALIQ